MAKRKSASSRIQRETPPLSTRKAASGLRALARDVTSAATRDWKLQQEAAEGFNAGLIGLLTQISGRGDIKGIIRRLRPEPRYRRPKKLPKPLIQQELGEVFLDPYGKRVVPPFDYSGTMPGSRGDADPATGALWFTIEPDGRDNFSDTACCTVGIHLAPFVDGTLAVWSNPSYNGSWSDYAWFAAAHSDAFIGLWIGQYDQNGVFETALVDQRNTLWNDNQHLGNSGPHTEQSTGYSLTASCSVEAGKQYVVAVSIAGNASAHRTWGASSSASSALLAAVPSITWELT